jgi:hypothetical protein
LVGSAAERVALVEPPSDETSETAARFFIEQHGQDALSLDAKGPCLIQFKYSQDARPIKPSELADILLSLEKSSKDLPRKGGVHWRLITNRKLSATAKTLHDDARRAKGPRTRRGTGAGSDSGAVISRLGAQLEDVVEKDLDQFKVSLVDAAKKFGVDDDGVADRVMTLLLEVARNAPNRREVSVHALNEKLAGYRKPKSIRLKDCRQDWLSTLASAVGPGGQGGITLDEAVDRPVLGGLFAERAALAVVYGPGGCGKTLSLFRALDQRLKDDVGLAAMIVNGPRTLGHVVDEWRNARSVGETPKEALRRLCVANPGVGRPVLVLGLDGLDEVAASDRMEAENLIRYFHTMHVELHSSQAEPDGLLVVTCRAPEELDDIVAPLGVGGAPLPPIPRREIGEFSDEEFSAVWARWFPDEPVPRLGVEDEMLATVAETVAGPRPADQRLRALRHPVLLGCMKSFSPQQRQQLYQGDGELWRQVLNSYFTWFSRKASARAGCSLKKVREVLKAVARATAGKSGACDRDGDWVAPAVAHTGDTRHLVGQIFDDAVTAGVVNAGRRRYAVPTGTPIEWRWRFPELAAHLASLA